MSKLFKLKSWLTLDEAAAYLSGAMLETVSVADLLRLALDGHLVLSALFPNHATATLGRKVSFSDAKLWVFPNLGKQVDPAVREKANAFPAEASREEQHAWLVANRDVSDGDDFIITIKGDRIAADSVLEWEEGITSIRGVWDIPTAGGAKLDLEHLLQQMVDGPEITLGCIDGAFVVNPDGIQYARLMEHYSKNPYCADGNDREKYPHGSRNSYYPTGGLPDDALLVARPASLTAFLASLENGGSEQDAGIDVREKASLLRIIRALSAMAGLPERGAATSVAMQLEQLGFVKPGEATIRKVLADARALDRDSQ